MEQKPVVTVSVITYNSSKYVLETLDSIAAQTYPNLILQISDDCSTDNTLDLCREWLKLHEGRFVKTKFLTIDHNTGVSANGNRAMDACETEWHKSIAGDDILMPDCIEAYVSFIADKPDAVIVFARMKSFGATKEKCEHADNVMIKYVFFHWNSDRQLDHLCNVGNCIPAPTAFYNVNKMRAIGLRNDERIPLLEDLPKWHNALRMGVKFLFLDYVTVRYRIHEASLSSTPVSSAAFYESVRQYWFYYCFNQLYQSNQNEAIEKAVRYEVDFYRRYYLPSLRDLEIIKSSYSYRIGRMLVFPFILIRECMRLFAQQFSMRGK